MRILRVFPRKTTYTPNDELTFIGMPPFREMMPEHDEVHVSCTFTWDKAYCQELAYQWEDATDKPVKLGGVAFGSPADKVWQAMGQRPLFGHHSGKKSLTFWGVFMKGLE